jgi:hypothetical protein
VSQQDETPSSDRNQEHPLQRALQENQIDVGPRETELTHKVPRLPILLDDRHRLDPLVIRRWAGQPLHTVVDQEALDGEILRVFTDFDKAKEYVSGLTFEEPDAPGAPDRGLRPAEQPSDPRESSHPPIAGGSNGLPPGGVPPDGGFIDLFEHVDFGGCTWRVREWERKTVRNFSDFWACGFLWWGWKNANDQVSSVDTLVSGNRPVVVMWEHALLTGSTIAFFGRGVLPSLVPFGWNDRASSLQIWYF